MFGAEDRLSAIAVGGVSKEWSLVINANLAAEFSISHALLTSTKSDNIIDR